MVQVLDRSSGNPVLRRPLAWLALAALALIGIRALLPVLLERHVNRVVDRSERYEGRIEDVDLALLRGGYTIEHLRLDYRELEELRPLIRAERIDLTLEWRALLRGALVGEMHAYRVVYNLVAAPPAADDLLAQSGEEAELGERASELFPFTINRLELHDGEIHYLDPFRSPPVDVAVEQVELIAENWSNVQDRKQKRFARAWLRGRSFDSARLLAALEADPFASPPEFRFAAIAEGADLTELNDFLRAYANFDAERGTLSVYLEVDAKDGRYEGYVKPVIEDLEVLGSEQGDWGDRIWEGLVGALAELFENQMSGHQASRIPIGGTWGDAAPDLYAAIGSVLRNAFIEALLPQLENPEKLVAPSEEE